MNVALQLMVLEPLWCIHVKQEWNLQCLAGIVSEKQWAADVDDHSWKNIKEQSMPLSQGLSGLPEDSMGQTAVVEVTVANGNNSTMSEYGNGDAI